MSVLKKASDYLIHRAYTSYNENCGKCAKFVREAVEFAIDPKTIRRVTSAKDYGKSYEEIGFKKVDIKDYQPRLGDICILQYEPHGHISMYCDGVCPKTQKPVKCWISDFRQIDYYGGKIRNKKPKFEIYRLEQ